MINYFGALNEQEKASMRKAPLHVAILIAGADNKIDKMELKEAMHISRYKPIKARNLLMEFYKEISHDFEFNLIEEIASLPREARKRNPIIISELEKLNRILPKLDRKFALQFYESMKDIAHRIAKASGGVLGYISIDYEESKLIELKMIKNPANYK